MAHRVFVAATGQHCGKTTLSYCIVHLARAHGHRVAFMKPVGQQHVHVNGLDVDKDVALIASQFGLEADLPHMSPVVVKSDVTRKAIDGVLDTAQLAARITHAQAALEARADFLVIEGTGHTGVGAVLGLSNAQVARLMEAPTVIVSGGGIGKAVDAVVLNHALFREEGVAVRGVFLNKLLPDKRESTLGYVQKALARRGLQTLRGLDFSPVLANPTLAHVSQVLGVPVQGASEGPSRIAHSLQLGAARAQRVVDLLARATLLVLNSTRDEVLVTLSSLYRLPEYHERLAGLVIAGLTPVAPITQRILDASGLPYLRVPLSSGEAFGILLDSVSKLGPEDHEKLALLRAQAEQTLDFRHLERLLAG